MKITERELRLLVYVLWDTLDIEDSEELFELNYESRRKLFGHLAYTQGLLDRGVTDEEVEIDGCEK